MPCAWAETWGKQEAKEWKASAVKPYESYTEKRAALSFFEEEDILANSPLPRLIIETEEWFEEDTYYIRYTFTNPTNKKVEETVSRTDVKLLASSREFHGTYIIKHDSSPEWLLCIEPQSSISRTITLPKEPAFHHFVHEQTKFYLANGSMLSYLYWGINSSLSGDTAPMTPPAKIDFQVEPITLDKGKLTVTITNQSSETLSELRHILLHARTEKYKGGFTPDPLADSITLDLSPNETKTVHITVPIWNYLNNDPVCTAYPDLNIDGLRYEYDPYEKDFYPLKRITYYAILPEVSRPPELNIFIFGNMEVRNDVIFYYLTFYNDTDSTQKIDRLFISSDYEDMFYTRKNIFWDLSIQDNPIRLYPGQSKRYVIPLPILTDDADTILASTTTIASGMPLNFANNELPKISAEPLHPMQKVFYIPLPYSVHHVTPSYPKYLPLNQ